LAHGVLRHSDPSCVHEVDQSGHGGGGDSLQRDPRHLALLQTAGEHRFEIGTGGGEDHSVGVEHFVADFQSDIGQHLMTPHHVHCLKADKLDSCSSHLNQLPSSLP
jgi:hypothetical protein